MADRRSLFSRFWPASASRRTSTTQTTTAPPPAITISASTDEAKPVSQPNSASTTPPVSKTGTPARQSTTIAGSPPAPITQPTTGRRMADQPSGASPEPRKSPSSEVQTASQPIAITSTSAIANPQTTSPSRPTTQSPSPSKPASPYRRVAQSRTPPQPSSPSHAAPQARREGSETAQTPSTPKKASQPRSPSRLTSNSPEQGSSSAPKGTQPTSPSKESKRPTQEAYSPHEAPTMASNGHSPKPAASNEETKKEANNVAPKSGSEAQIIEKTEIPGKPYQMEREKQEAADRKEISATSLPGATPSNTTTSQPKKSSTISGTHNKSALPNGQHVPVHKNITGDVSKFVDQMATGDPRTAIYDKPVSVITLAGENRGASMQMEPNSPKGERPIHIHRSYKINPDESAEATTDEEGSSEQKKSEDANSTDDQPTEAYVNNNAQGINNSIVFDSSITEGNPGVHVVVTHVPKEPIQSTDKTSPPEARKAEFNMTRTDRLTYQPTVRRRCLRGLFLETSDSDPENPEKPRRHGCRVSCQQRDKEDNTDVL